MKSHDTTTLWLWHFSIKRKSSLTLVGWLLLRHWLLLQGGIYLTQQRLASTTPKGYHWSIRWWTPLWTLQTLSSSSSSSNGAWGWAKPIQTEIRSFPRRGRNILQRRDFYTITNCLESRKQKSSCKKYCYKKCVFQHLSKNDQSYPEKGVQHKNDRYMWIFWSRLVRIHQIYCEPEKTFHRSQSLVNVRR